MSKLQRITISDVSPPSRVSRLWQTIRSHLVGPISVSSHEWEAFYGRPQAGSAGLHVDENTALNYSAVWSAVSLIAGQVGNLPCVLNRKLKPRGKERFGSHPTYRLIHDRPNPETSAFVFRETLQAHVLLWGNAYAEIERDAAGRPMALWPITPDRVMPFRNSRGLQYRVKNSGGPESIYDASDMLHIPGLGWDGVCGYSVISKARESMGLGMATERFGSSFFGNGSTFGGILAHPGRLTEPARKNLVDSLQRQHQGVDRAHKFVILEEGMKYDKVGIPPNDAQFLETRTFQVTEIARWFNLPPHKLKELTRSTNNNIEHQNLEYYIDCLAPWLEKWEQELNEKLVSPLERNNQEIEFVADGLLRGDSTARGESQSKGFSVAALTPNDIRDMENRNPLEGGDDAFVAMNLIPLRLAPAYWEVAIEKTKAETDVLKRPPPPPPAPPPNNEPALKREIERLTEELATARRCGQEAEDAKGVAVAELRTKLDEQAAVDVALRVELAGVQVKREAAEAERETLKTEAAEKVTEILSLQDRIVETQQAVRASVVDRIQRLIEIETERARRAQGSPDKLRKSMEQFYEGHADRCREMLRPCVRAWAVSTGDAEPLEHVLDVLISQHLEQSVRQLRTVADESNAETLAPSLEKLLRRWEVDRAETLVARVLEAT